MAGGQWAKRKTAPKLAGRGSARTEVWTRARMRETDFAAWADEIGAYALLSPEEEQRLGRRAFAGDVAAQHALIEANLRLVASIAAEYRPVRLGLLDLMQEGAIGLVRASEKFNPDGWPDIRFATYAGWWVRQAISRALRAKDRMIAVPVYAQTGKNKRRVAVPPDAVSLDQHVVEAAGHRGGGDPNAANQPTSLGDLVPDKASEPMEARAERVEESTALYAALRTLLTERERTVLALRFGLVAGEYDQTHKAIGRRLGLYYERVRQIEVRALAKLRAGMAPDGTLLAPATPASPPAAAATAALPPAETTQDDDHIKQLPLFDSGAA
jgi:RNA polymerase sigma factor (sigma-70 family)